MKLKKIVEKVIDNRGKTPPLVDNGYELLEVNAVNESSRTPDYQKVRKFVSKDTYENWFRTGNITYNDILIPTVGTIGGCCISKQERGSIAQNLIALRINKQIADPDYIFYYFRTSFFKKELLNLDIGGVQPSIKVPHLLNLEISLPPISEQKRISSILSSFDNKIEQLKKQNNILEDIAQSIFKEWFVKYNFPNKDGKPYKDNNGKMINSELGLIPEGWRVGKLGEITSITSGKNLPKKDLATKGKYEVLGANGKIGETNKYLFDKQLIFTGRVGTLGNVFLSNEPAWYSDNTLLIFPKNNFLYYVYRYLQRQRLEKLDRGSTQPLITQTDLKTILLPIPFLSLLNKFEKISTLINNKITQNKNNIDYFQKIKTALLNKLILA